MPLVTAIIPTRNRPELVCRAVRSVLYQTVGDVEVIVVIDGHDPATVQALDLLDDARVHVIALTESVGGSEARNVGARGANSPWVALLDDDDEWLPDKLRVQLECARSLPHSNAIITSRYILRHVDGDQVLPIRFPFAAEPLSEYLFSTTRNLFQTSTLMCSRELLQRVPFKKGLKRLQDWDWLLRVTFDKDVLIACVPDTLSIYNVKGDIATITKSLDWEGSLRWARENRSFMTSRAYTSFIAKKCAPDASGQKAGVKAIGLFLECTFGEKLNLNASAKFILYYLLTEAQRRQLGNFLSEMWRSLERRRVRSS